MWTMTASPLTTSTAKGSTLLPSLRLHGNSSPTTAFRMFLLMWYSLTMDSTENDDIIIDTCTCQSREHGIIQAHEHTKIKKLIEKALRPFIQTFAPCNFEICRCMNSMYLPQPQPQGKNIDYISYQT